MPATVTRRSAIASKSAACVLGGARLAPGVGGGGGGGGGWLLTGGGGGRQGAGVFGSWPAAPFFGQTPFRGCPPVAEAVPSIVSPSRDSVRHVPRKTVGPI